MSAHIPPLLRRWQALLATHLIPRLVPALLVCLLLAVLLPASSAPVEAATTTTTAQQQQTVPHDDGCTIFGVVNFCDLMARAFGPIMAAVVTKIATQWSDWIEDVITSVGRVIYTTPKEMTYQFPDHKPGEHNAIELAYDGSLSIANSLLSIAIIWTAIRLMLSGNGRWTVYARLVEVLPRLILGFLAANFSLSFITLLIQGNNAICDIYAPTVHGSVHAAMFNFNLFTEQAKADMFTAIFIIIYGILTLCLLVFAYIRLATIIVLMVTAPLWMIMWTTPQTQQIARFCTSATVMLIFTQAIQVIVMGLSVNLIASLVEGKEGDPGTVVANACVAIAVNIVILLIPKWTVSWINTPTDGGVSKVVSSIVSLAR